MRRLTLALLVVALAGSAALVTTKPAAASDSSACGRKVINDWYDNGRIDGTYPIACYRAALNELPEDVIQYADAHDVISRAMALAIINSKKSDSNGPQGTTPSDTSTGPASTNPAQTETSTETDTTKSGGAPSPGGTGPTGTSAGTHDTSPVSHVITAVGPSNATSVPVPLIVLGVLALLLLAAGAAGVVARKLQERRVPATPGGSPPSESPPAT